MIVAAAVKVRVSQDNKIYDFVFPCHRHSDIPYILCKLKAFYEVLEEGFLTDKGEFLNRYDASTHAYECSQLVETIEEPYITCLFSEDLW